MDMGDPSDGIVGGPSGLLHHKADGHLGSRPPAFEIANPVDLPVAGLERHFRQRGIHKVPVPSEGNRRFKLDRHKPRQAGDRVSRQRSTVVRPWLKNRIPQAAGVGVGQDVVVAEDVIAGWDAITTTQTLVDGSGNGSGGDVLVAHAESAHPRPYAPRQTLGPNVRDISPGKDLSHLNNVGAYLFPGGPLDGFSHFLGRRLGLLNEIVGAQDICRQFL